VKSQADTTIKLDYYCAVVLCDLCRGRTNWFTRYTFPAGTIHGDALHAGFVIFTLCSLKNAAQIQGVRAAAGAFEAADTAEVVGALLRLNVVLAELVAAPAVRACAAVHPQEEGGASLSSPCPG
jgi:uncharacterized protein (DUF3820 family)